MWFGKEIFFLFDYVHRLFSACSDIALGFISNPIAWQELQRYDFIISLHTRTHVSTMHGFLPANAHETDSSINNKFHGEKRQCIKLWSQSEWRIKDKLRHLVTVIIVSRTNLIPNLLAYFKFLALNFVVVVAAMMSNISTSIDCYENQNESYTYTNCTAHLVIFKFQTW